jgi:hypothetical protein
VNLYIHVIYLISSQKAARAVQNDWWSWSLWPDEIYMTAIAADIAILLLSVVICITVRGRARPIQGTAHTYPGSDRNASSQVQRGPDLIQTLRYILPKV